MTKSHLPISYVALITANIVPIFGVLFLGYDLGNLLLIYWAESAIIGLYTLVKMLVRSVHDGLAGLFFLFIGPFFVVHFGGFMAGHLVFILGIAGGAFQLGIIDSTLSEIFVEKTTTIHLALLALVISHGISFAQNYIGKREYEKLEQGELMFAPYGRIIIMHITIILGAFATIIFGNSIMFLVLFVFLKIFMDAGAHMREHKKLGSI